VRILHWGWCKVAQLLPDWDDAPTFDVLILTLDKTQLDEDSEGRLFDPAPGHHL
jgi:hypothetical protein